MYSIVQKCINKRRDLKAQQAQQQKKNYSGDSDDEIEESNFLDLLFEVGYSDEIVRLPSWSCSTHTLCVFRAQ